MKKSKSKLDGESEAPAADPATATISATPAGGIANPWGRGGTDDSKKSTRQSKKKDAGGGLDEWKPNEDDDGDG